MLKLVDLHTHSTASDGQYPPGRLVELACERGVELLALTDHDTLDGLEEAVRAGEERGLAVIRGVELGAMEYRNFHILGYGFSREAPALRRLCGYMKAQRDARKHRILELLRSKGLDMDLAEVEAQAGGNVISRPHFARVMVDRGYVADLREAFDRYLDTEEYERIRQAKIPARTCVEAIKSDGGKAVLAHPYQLGLSGDVLRERVRELAEWGLDGLECHYPRHSAEQTAFYLRLAREFGLRVTGGSDFHGERVKPDISLAAISLDVDWLIQK